MRNKLIVYLKGNPNFLHIIWELSRFVLTVIDIFIPIKKKRIVFASFGGRKYDDSPKAIYDEICKRRDFNKYELVWAFVNPDEFSIPRGKKIKIDTIEFFLVLLTSKVWISNSSMDRGIGFTSSKIIRVETWHGAPVKKYGGAENQTSMVSDKEKKHLEKKELDSKTIRCAQSEFDRDINADIEHADKSSYLMCGLPRNDSLFTYSSEDVKLIKQNLNIDINKKVILYTPTYREYLINEDKEIYLAPPISFEKWESLLSDKYVVLIRAHYAVSAALSINESDFLKDVSNYPTLNDLYIISDLMISDYSSTFFDYSILNRPMFCYAYDLDEYKEKRGFFLELSELPCDIDLNEDDLLNHILNMDEEKESRKSKCFNEKYASTDGKASKFVVDEIINRL